MSESPLALARHLRASFPTYRVRVRRLTLRDAWADCDKQKDGSYLIRIEKRVDATAQTILLIHEWAHVLSWETDRHPSDHGGRFGWAYSRVYQAYLDWLK